MRATDLHASNHVTLPCDIRLLIQRQIQHHLKHWASMSQAPSPATSASAASSASTETVEAISQHVHDLQLQVNLLESRIRVLEDRSDLSDQACSRLESRVGLLEHWCQSLRSLFARLP